jgi:hypothetical protein
LAAVFPMRAGETGVLAWSDALNVKP